MLNQCARITKDKHYLFCAPVFCIPDACPGSHAAGRRIFSQPSFACHPDRSVSALADAKWRDLSSPRSPSRPCVGARHACPISFPMTLSSSPPCSRSLQTAGFLRAFVHTPCPLCPSFRTEQADALSFHVRSCERVGLRREKSLFAFCSAITSALRWRESFRSLRSTTLGRVRQANARTSE
jgi:hypothetical protein